MLRLREFKFDDRTARVTEVADWFRDTDAALVLFYSTDNPGFGTRFTLYSPVELARERTVRRQEADVLAALGVLSATEAALREDFIVRCIKRRSDPLSRYFEGLYKSKGLRVSLEDEILQGWKVHSTIQAHVVGQIKAAFKYRHWIAHGRYWEPKLGQNFDFFSTYQIASTVLSGFPLLRR